MVDFDPLNTQADKAIRNPHAKPTIAELKTAITGSAQAASYPAAYLRTCTKNDLIGICRTHGITVTTTSIP